MFVLMTDYACIMFGRYKLTNQSLFRFAKLYICDLTLLMAFLAFNLIVLPLQFVSFILL